MSKIQLTDNMLEIVTKMSAGNVGAVTVLVQLFQNNGEIDPDSALGPLGTILSMDDLGIYGSAIYILYKDKCKGSIRDLIMLFRAYQLGFISQNEIIAASEDQSRTINIDLDSLNTQVCERLESFSK